MRARAVDVIEEDGQLLELQARGQRSGLFNRNPRAESCWVRVRAQLSATRFYVVDLTVAGGRQRSFRLADIRNIYRVTGEIFGYRALFRLDFGASALTFAARSDTERDHWLRAVQAAVRRPAKIVDVVESVDLVDFGDRGLPGPAWPHSGRSLTSLD